MAKDLSPMMQQYFKIKEQYPDTILFFRLGWRLFAFFWLMLLWLLALLTQNAFSRLSRTAGYLLLPQLLWVA